MSQLIDDIRGQIDLINKALVAMNPIIGDGYQANPMALIETHRKLTGLIFELNAQIDKDLAQIDERRKSIALIKELKLNIEKELASGSPIYNTDYHDSYLALIDERRKLLKISEAEMFNPAAAVYGESQKGKSFLISNLLQDCGQPFMIHYGDKDYDFIRDLSPKRDGAEATGVVTRFTSFNRCPELYSDRYPIMMRTLTVSDIVLILTRFYFNDVRNYTVPEDITGLAERIFKRYSTYPIVEDSRVSSEDILEMEPHFTKYINNARAFCRSDFFKSLALVVNRIPLEDYSEVFGYFWDHEPNLTGLFVRLFDVLRQLQFNRYVYLPIEAVEHRFDDCNTIMSKSCQLGYSEGSHKPVDVYVRDSEGYRTISGVRKCDLAAVCQEVLIKIPDDFIQSADSYCLDGITDEDVRVRITNTPVHKDVFSKIDLLEFPGTYSRKKVDRTILGEGHILMHVFSNAKTAYLFDKHNDDYVISILLFCHDAFPSNLTVLPTILENWVNNYIGRTPDERAETIRMCGGISPLFYIATKFNMDMAVEPIGSKNSVEAMNSRWDRRFYRVVFNECFNGSVIKWVTNWTKVGERFNNSYLLRDFKYSGQTGSRLYDGFSHTGRETELIVPQDYYDTMRDTFINSKHVRQFFSDPALSWDLAATINNDGALYIIENLAKAADKINQVRDRQFTTIKNDINQRLNQMLSK